MTTYANQFAPGSLVHTRGRDWVVIPSDEEGLIRLRPVDSTENDAIGIYIPLEGEVVRETKYPLPNPELVGNSQSALLLRDAVRLTLRSGAGPFRSIGRLSVNPRPYQFVPLIMALKMDPVRLLIADDVGIGKTIESAMIARELLDRGIAKRLAVICPPHLCDQWENELRTKFNIDTAIIQPSRIARLEREIPRQDISVYQYYRHMIVSIDYIKSDKNKRPFIDHAPDLIIVDEAHTAARPAGAHNQQQLRHEFLRDLMKSSNRHLIMATATPHSGIDESFRSLLELLDSEFKASSGEEIPKNRLVKHMVQRQRSDIRNWLGDDTPFPDRDSIERTYQMSTQYLKLFEDVVTYCRNSVSQQQGLGKQQERVRYWAALAILRCILSSPDAAASVLENRKNKTAATDPSGDFDEFTDETFANQILDSSENEQPPDYTPTVGLDGSASELTSNDLRLLNRFLKESAELRGPTLDTKLAESARIVSELLKEGYSPIIYCRFIATAQYVSSHLQEILTKEHPKVKVEHVSGDDGGNEQRKEKVDRLAEEQIRVLVATDCLSEGINLQEQFDAVVHYDLPWNPNRLEQRIGRVDRYGQQKPRVKEILLHGVNNQFDIIILDVLLRKNKSIRDALGVSIPMPVEADRLVTTLVDTLLLRQSIQSQQLQLALNDPETVRLHTDMDKAAEKEKQNRSYFSQQGIKPDEVAKELEEMNPALGTPQELQRFVGDALQRFGGDLKEDKPASYNFIAGDLGEIMKLRSNGKELPDKVIFDGIQTRDITLLGRNHPIIETLTGAVLEKTLSGNDPNFARCGAIFTDRVNTITTVAILRLRYLLQDVNDQFAEEVVMAAFESVHGELTLLQSDEDIALKLIRDPKPTANMPAIEAQRHVEKSLEYLTGDSWYQTLVDQRVASLQGSHNRLRDVVKGKDIQINPHTPPDILGVYVMVPSAGGV